MSEIRELFRSLDKEARKVATVKDLLSGLVVRDMPDVDKLRLAKAFIHETKESLMEMLYIIDQYNAYLVGKDVMK